MTGPSLVLDRFAARVAAADWAAVTAEVDDQGCALLPQLLTGAECAELAALYDEPHRFRSTVDMERYRFGRGQYRYFAAPFPEPVAALRRALYPRLLPIARDWYAKLGRTAEWPDTLDGWLDVCHAAGQTRPTPILLRYGPGDWNALHRDLYGDKVFPLQVVINLNDPTNDHTGGEFLLVEQRPRAQSRGTATLIPHGHGLVFTTPPDGRRLASVPTPQHPENVDTHTRRPTAQPSCGGTGGTVMAADRHENVGARCRGPGGAPLMAWVVVSRRT